MTVSVRVRGGDKEAEESEVAVAHHERAFTPRSFQRTVHALSARCRDITVTGCFDVEAFEVLPVVVRGAVSRLSVLDADENGSLRGEARVLVVGNLKQLTKLVIKCHCQVHVLGELEAHAELCITAAALYVNGVRVPGAGTDSQLFQWYRQPRMMACAAVRVGQTEQAIRTTPPPCVFLY